MGNDDMFDSRSSYTLSRHSSIDGAAYRPLPAYPGENVGTGKRRSWMGSISLGRSISLRRNPSSASSRPSTMMSENTKRRRLQDMAKSAGRKLIKSFAIFTPHDAMLYDDQPPRDVMVPAPFVF